MLKCPFNLSVVILIERSRRGSYHVIFQVIKNILLLIALQHWRTWLSEPAVKKALQCDSDWCVAFVEASSSICLKVVVELQILESGTARYVHASTVDLNNILNSPNFIWIGWDFIVYKVIASWNLETYISWLGLIETKHLVWLVGGSTFPQTSLLHNFHCPK